MSLINLCLEITTAYIPWCICFIRPGCPTSEYYGENCSLHCPENCQDGHCHIVDGTCFGCKVGYSGANCGERTCKCIYVYINIK